MASLSGRMEKRMQAKDEAERTINAQAEIIALKRKAAAWGANENEDSITSFTGRWEALANWFGAPVGRQGVLYPSVEHAFQAAKAAADPEAAESIRKAKSPKEAHELGAKVALPRDWERRKLGLMQALLRDKFRRDPALRDRLVRTERKNLIAGNDWGEGFWGVSAGRGDNQLGKLLMALRDEIAAGTDADAWLRDGFDLATDEALETLSFDVSKQGKQLEAVEVGRLALTFVGKHSTCQLQLEHPSLSRRHAVIVQDKTRGTLLVDLASKAGVTLNGRRLPPSLGVPVKDGGAIVFGGYAER